MTSLLRDFGIAVKQDPLTGSLTLTLPADRTIKLVLGKNTKINVEEPEILSTPAVIRPNNTPQMRELRGNWQQGPTSPDNGAPLAFLPVSLGIQGFVDFAKARQKIAEWNKNGEDNVRLPSGAELSAIHNHMLAIGGIAENSLPISGVDKYGCYWSSDTTGNGLPVWHTLVNPKALTGTPDDRNRHVRALLVREINPG